ncbi:hypothetical protein SSX86_008760 [Deinandra increscens subsp. villosa]|uniref:Gnk2-homologous domain-containing protein n=1 Tax=Deinandra increscens subsp. villosa TaxID=3103831 RepID=A0AAP0H5C1_9ASTR
METKSLIQFIFLLQVIINGVIAQKPAPTQQSFKCRDNGNFKTDTAPNQREGAFQNVYRLIGEPGSTTFAAHHNNFSTTNKDDIWGSVLCPPNIKLEACRECLNNTYPYLIKNCPKQREGVAWTSLPKVTCIVTYRDYLFQVLAPDWAWGSFSTPPNQAPASAVDLEKGLNTLAGKLKGLIVPPVKSHFFAYGSLDYGPGPKGSWPLYGHMQCNSNLRIANCLTCLTDATNEIHKCCSRGRKLSGIALGINCYFRYAHTDFTPKALPTLSSSFPQT